MPTRTASAREPEEIAKALTTFINTSIMAPGRPVRRAHRARADPPGHRPAPGSLPVARVTTAAAVSVGPAALGGRPTLRPGASAGTAPVRDLARGASRRAAGGAELGDRSEA